MQISELFKTPLWEFSYPDLALLQEWSHHILTLEREDRNGLVITNQGGWHSRTNLLEDAALHGLFRWIAGCTQEAMQGFGWDFGRATPCFNNAWAMVNREGHSVRAHLHPNSLFSGVVYLHAPPGCGAIAFLDPRGGSQMLIPPLQQQVGDGVSGRVCREPRTGLMFLFPAWLWHEVEPSQTNEARICLSFNVGMRPLSG
jgi:uncharacterized protein (TIGR02466 family)